MIRGFRHTISTIAVVAIMMAPTAVQADPLPAISNLVLETTLKNLKLPVGYVNGKWDEKSKRAICGN